jgi:hypothetical protein
MPRQGTNRLHFDIAPSGGTTQDDAVERLLAFGATVLEIDPDGSGRLVLADPDGNDLCLLSAIPPQ